MHGSMPLKRHIESTEKRQLFCSFCAHLHLPANHSVYIPATGDCTHNSHSDSMKMREHGKRAVHSMCDRFVSYHCHFLFPFSHFCCCCCRGPASPLFIITHPKQAKKIFTGKKKEKKKQAALPCFSSLAHINERKMRKKEKSSQ